MPPPVRDLTGQRFGRLVVVTRAGLDRQSNATWNCACDCGSETVVSGLNLVQEHTLSCGCLRNEGRKPRHGHALRVRPSPEYSSWSSAKQRVTNPNADNWPYYGGRGIAMAQEWLDSFEAFLRDMGPRPSGTSLDRIDPNGNYEPGNCRWATKSEQALNQRPRRRAA